MIAEQWCWVPDYEGIYQVSTFGRVKRFYKWRKARILKPAASGGYSQVVLSRGGKHKTFLVHRLVAEAFIPNPDNKPQVNHINGIKTDNRVENLEWCTSSENNQHAVTMGLMKVGEESPCAKLNVEQVHYIRDNPDKLNLMQLAKMFGVDQSTISLVQLGKSYKSAGGSLRQAQKRTFLSDDIRDQIRAEYKPRVLGCYALAKKYGVHPTTILNIVHGK